MRTAHIRTALLTPFVALALAAPSTAFAQFGLITSGIEGCDFQTGELEASCIPSFVGHLVQLVFTFAGVICLIIIMYSGYEIAIGGVTGDTTGGKQNLMHALIGLAVCISAFLIVDFVISALLGQ